MRMKLSDFDYVLPAGQIAQRPLEGRDASRVLLVDRGTASDEDRMFRDFPSFLAPGDCLALNNSRVFPSRLFGHRAGAQGVIEVFLLRPADARALTWCSDRATRRSYRCARSARRSATAR